MSLSILAAVALASPGLNLSPYSLSEAKMTALLPNNPALVSSGAFPDVPQSVMGYSWRSEGEGVKVTITYDKWKSVHFSPEIELDRLARQDWGLLDGYTVTQVHLGALTGALLVQEQPQGCSRAVLRAKSETEAWQITLTPTDGLLSLGEIEDIRAGLNINAQPEIEGLYTAWGERVRPEIISRPAPSLFAWRKATLEGLSLEAPVELQPFNAARSEAELAKVGGIKEWRGEADQAQVLVSTFEIKTGEGVDLAAWGKTFAPSLERDGFREWHPERQAFEVKGASALRLFAASKNDGAAYQVEVILIVKGQRAWAVQTRCPDTREGREAIEQVRDSIVVH